MKRKIFAVLGFLIIIVCVQFSMNSQPFSQFLLKTDNLKISEMYGGDYVLFANYTNSGDFIRWNPVAGSFTTFTDTGDNLYVKQQGSGVSEYEQEGWAKFDCADILGLSNITVAYRMKTTKLDTYVGIVSIWMRFYYDDGSYSLIFSQSRNAHDAEIDTGTIWTSASPSSGKTVAYVMLYVSIYHNPPQDEQGKVELWLYDEVYRGFSPFITNFTVLAASIVPFTPTLCSINGINASIASIQVVSEWGGFVDINLYKSWEMPTLWLNSTQFMFEGYYSYHYALRNSWNITTYTDAFVFRITYDTFPKHSYLSLYNLLSGFPLASKDFKIFLGDPDSRDLINFRSYFGNWSQLNSNGIVNASLITDGVLGMNESIDNYINISAYHNGLASPFENGMIYNTTTWTVLEFQVKVFQPTWIVIIYNPVLWEKDFYLEFTEGQIGYWFDVQIPFFNFTTYVDITHNLLYELGWWIENATILLANIRVAAYYSWNGSAYIENSYRLCALENRQEPDDLVFDSPIETICIQDFFNNTLYYADVAYTPFLDIGLPICLFTFYNWEDYSVIIRIYRGLGTFIEIVVPPHCSTTQEVFCTNYRIWTANSAMQTLRITYVSPNQTRNVIIPWGYNQTITPPNFWEQLIQFLFHTKLGFGLFLILCGYFALQIYGIFRRRKFRIVHQEAEEGKVKI